MKIQACKFRRTKGQAILGKDVVWEDGIAFMNDAYGFDSGGVDFIVDAEGKKLKKVYDWRLKEGPMCYIDTNY